MKTCCKNHSLFIVVFSLFVSNLIAQKQANYWYFADLAGLHFANGEPEILNDGQIDAATCIEASSAISDSSGQLLFYCCAKKIYNRLHQIMPNGDHLLGGGSSTQGALIVPMPGSDERFYVFTLDEFQNNLANGLNYYIVNMCLDNGLGDVELTPSFATSVQKGTLLLADAGEKLCATYHQNGADIWVVTRKHFSNEFYSFLITELGIQDPTISAIGWDNSNPDPDTEYSSALGQIKISPDGSKLAMAVGNHAPGYVQLFDFDNSTGQLTNEKTLYADNASNQYGIAFSPDNTKLYMRGAPPTGIRQFDITLSGESEIVQSAAAVPWIGGYGGTGMQLANNGKIYVSFNTHLGVINAPNLSVPDCNYIGEAIDIYAAIGTFSSYTLPSFMDGFNYHNGIPACLPDSQIELAQNDFIVLSPMPCNSHLVVASSHTNIHISQLKIVNATGQTMAQLNASAIGQFKFEIDTSDLPNGVYFLEILTNENKFFRKIVVDR